MNLAMKIIINAAKETPRGFFAPLVGAYKGICAELRAMDSINKPNINKKVHSRT